MSTTDDVLEALTSIGLELGVAPGVDLTVYIDPSDPALANDDGTPNTEAMRMQVLSTLDTSMQRAAIQKGKAAMKHHRGRSA